MQFITSKGEVVTGKRLRMACDVVALWYEENAKAVRKDDHYASHITELRKDQLMQDQFKWADDVRMGKNLHNFSVWQRVNLELTGESVALLNL